MTQAFAKDSFEFLDSGMISSSDFASRVIKSGLVSRADVESLWAGLDKSCRSPAGLATALSQQFRLTQAQASLLVETPDLPLVLGNYLIEDKLGAGGMGTVYRAVHRKMKRVVALKLISVKGDSAIRRFGREVELLARLSHANIVTAHDAGEVRGHHYLVMERVVGTDLQTLVESSGALDVIRAVDLVLQAARGLEYAHGEGIIHHDIKPANLLIDNHGTVKVLDLGIARLEHSDDEVPLADGLTNTSMMMGTIDFMSPEQAIDAKNAGPTSDIYSLGCTLFYILTGRAIYQGTTVMKRILSHRDDPIPKLPSNVSAPSDAKGSIYQLQHVFERMVAKSPANRFGTMTELVRAFVEISHGLNRSTTAANQPIQINHADHSTIYPDENDDTESLSSADTVETERRVPFVQVRELPSTSVKRASLNRVTFAFVGLMSVIVTC